MGRESYGDGSSIVVRERESRPHGEGRQVSGMQREREVRETRETETILSIIRGRGEHAGRHTANAKISGTRHWRAT